MDLIQGDAGLCVETKFLFVLRTAVQTEAKGDAVGLGSRSEFASLSYILGYSNVGHVTEPQLLQPHRGANSSHQRKD